MKASNTPHAATGTGQPSDPSHHHAEPHTLTAGVLFLLASFSALGALATNIILPSFPQMATDLGVSIRDLGVTLSSFFAAFALGQLFVGPLSDRFGRRPLVLLGLAVFVVGSIVCASSVTLPHLIVGRMIQALGACATSVLSRAIARDMFVGHALARTLSLVMVAMAAAPGFSPLLGGALDTLLGWRLTFIVVAVLAVIVGITYVAQLGESHSADKRAPLSLSSVLRGYFGLLVDKRFIVPGFAAGLIMASLYAYFALGSNILIVNFKLSTLPLGLFFASTVFVVFAGGLLASRLAKRWGAPSTARRAATIALAGAATLLFGPESLVTFCIGISIFLFGMGIFNPLAATIALNPFGKQAGSASALLGFLQMGLAAIAAAVGNILPLPVFLALGVILTSCVTAALALFTRIR